MQTMPPPVPPDNSTANLPAMSPPADHSAMPVDNSIQLTPDQLNAAGMADATPGSTWTLSVTVGTSDDSGASFSIDNASQENDQSGAGDDAAPKKEMPKVRESMKPVGPTDLDMN